MHVCDINRKDTTILMQSASECVKDIYEWVVGIYTVCRCVEDTIVGTTYEYAVATISWLLKIISLFCKRALWKRRYSVKETYDLKEPTHRSHPITGYTRWCHIWMRTRWSTPNTNNYYDYYTGFDTTIWMGGHRGWRHHICGGVTRTNEWCCVWMSCVMNERTPWLTPPHERVVARKNEWCYVCTSCGICEWVTSNMSESRHTISLSEWREHKSWRHVRMIDIMREWIMSRKQCVGVTRTQ